MKITVCNFMRGNLKELKRNVKIPPIPLDGQLAALGEVKESLGYKGAKAAIQAEFKRKYPRHSAFQGAMRSWM